MRILINMIVIYLMDITLHQDWSATIHDYI